MNRPAADNKEQFNEEEGPYIMSYQKIDTEILSVSAAQIMKKLTRKVNTMTSKLENRIESKSLKLFEKDYEHFLDILLEDGTSLLTITLTKDETENVSLGSSVKERLKKGMVDEK